ncbi:helix-turn-helix transcriptional regulator [Microvirga flavescens]|uniref:helix-turn-helix domain-containing protein n=1 Tax=Microvirga flavescens TaxID=2249811 RepID=UPI00315D85A8
MKKSPNDADRHIGRQIRARRIAIGMSQERLGELLGLTFQQIQKYEKGINRVGAGRLLEIGAFLQVPIAYFYEGLSEYKTSPGPEETIASMILATSDGQRLARAFSAIDKTQIRRKIIELMEAMSGI